jgi:hypothetical protein
MRCVIRTSKSVSQNIWGESSAAPHRGSASSAAAGQMKKIVLAIGVSAVILLGLGIKVRDESTVKLPKYPPTENVVWLGENWTAAQQEWFHHADQGTQTFGIPYEWFIALEQPELSFRAPRLVSDPFYLDRYGFIPYETNSGRPVFQYYKNAAVSPTSLPISERRGVSTSEACTSSALSVDQTKQILDTIADPTKSFFFNTDCISCHTETRRAMDILKVTNIKGIDTAALPHGQWDVRNFGWSPTPRGPAQATVTRRTAAETAAVVTFINSEVLPKQQH